ncbi:MULTISPECIES: AbiTii domain-containing protein [Morganellaceae]|uniref:AbiTii domain-containing protein n=2 Tax=Morganellaceae TaxID=1903414 RepID=D1P378_9GAMM|nr:MULTISPECIES: hypothetical protein [Morganellaceae]EFB71994.1 hypothetical protein PROVRUST_06748 [Providencia rustigianii DSM 4541]UNH37808.1 hypothetical protein MNY70_09780 [Moellerella wisconsensis]SUC27726.1 Uncharacterised protein [Providencia rustigianii]
MSILAEIQHDAINPEVRVADLLRKCLFLASKTGSDDFKNWVLHELDGYPSYDDVPDYRIISCHSKGSFSRYGGILKNLPIDLSILPEEYTELFGKMVVTNTVASIEGLLQTSESQIVKSNWNAEATRLVSDKIYQGMYCIEAWNETAIHLMSGILDSVKTKVLSIVLELENKLPDIEEVKLSKLDEKVVTQVFNNIINGNANIANSGENFTQNLQVQSNELVDKLVHELIDLKRQGKDCEVIDCLISHVESIKQVKDRQEGLEKVAKISSIAANSVTVLPVVGMYIGKLIELFS